LRRPASFRHTMLHRRRLYAVFPAVLCTGLVTIAAANDVVQYTVEEFAEAIETGFLDVIVDVRRTDEWEAGHIANATFVENLSLAGTDSEVTNYLDLDGCQECRIGVYCRSGARAGVAAVHLVANGFQNVYNGLGVMQWEDSGRSLVTTESRTAECTTTEDVCTASPGDGEECVEFFLFTNICKEYN